MNIIICIDKNFGVSFNNRRLSRDKYVIKDIIDSCDKIAISEYSLKLFNEYTNKIEVVSDFKNLQKACFIERDDLNQYRDEIKKLTVYKFDTVYPSDKKLAVDLKSFNLISATEFAGNSHDKIIKEVYIK